MKSTKPSDTREAVMSPVVASTARRRLPLVKVPAEEEKGEELRGASRKGE